MNGKQAKRLRRAVYGDKAFRVEPVYLQHETTRQIVLDPPTPKAKYRAAKRAYLPGSGTTVLNQPKKNLTGIL